MNDSGQYGRPRRYYEAEGFDCWDVRCSQCGFEWLAILERRTDRLTLLCPKCQSDSLNDQKVQP